MILVDFSEEGVQVVNVTPARLAVLGDDVYHHLLLSSATSPASTVELRRSVILTLRPPGVVLVGLV